MFFNVETHKLTYEKFFTGYKQTILIPNHDCNMIFSSFLLHRYVFSLHSIRLSSSLQFFCLLIFFILLTCNKKTQDFGALFS